MHQWMILLKKKVWSLMQPYLIEIAKDRHPNGCHILFENFSMRCIETLKEIIENEGIAVDYKKNEGTELFMRQIVWNVDGFWIGACRCYRNISDKVLIIKENGNGEILISIEKISKNKLDELRSCNTYIS